MYSIGNIKTFQTKIFWSEFSSETEDYNDCYLAHFHSKFLVLSKGSIPNLVPIKKGISKHIRNISLIKTSTMQSWLDLSFVIYSLVTLQTHETLKKIKGSYLIQCIKLKNSRVTRISKPISQKILGSLNMRAFVTFQFSYCPLLWMRHSKT